MAKKTKELSPEERLQEALVPEEEWPYEVPGNWCWTRLKYMALHISDGSHNPPPNAGAGIPLLSATNVHDGIVDYDSAIRWITEEEWKLENERTKIEKGDILITIVATIGRVAVVLNDKPFALQRSVAVIKSKIDSIFLAHYLETQYIQEYMNQNAKGTAQKGFYLNSLENLLCVIPPLPEQHRIVARIESLFAKLDEAKEAAQAVVDGFEDRKAAILHKAFTGDLTREWREKRQIPIDSWVAERIEARFDVTGGLQKTPSRSPRDNPIPYITVANVFRNYIKFSEIRYFEVTKEELERLQLKNKDLLIVEGNGSGNEIGRCAMWHNELPVCIHQNHIIRARAKTENTSPEFVLYYLNSPDGSAIVREKAVTTAGLYNLSVGKVKTIVLSFPCIIEQQEIVRRLDAYLEKDVQIKESAESVLDQIDTMKKAILARAFRGELGTNDPGDESAVELVKRGVMMQ